jgi:hypothetical protein
MKSHLSVLCSMQASDFLSMSKVKVKEMLKGYFKDKKEV